MEFPRQESWSGLPFPSAEDGGGTILNRSDEIREVCVWVNVMKIILHFQNIGANIKDFFFYSDLFHMPALFHHLFNSFTSVVIGG